MNRGLAEEGCVSQSVLQSRPLVKEDSWSARKYLRLSCVTPYLYKKKPYLVLIWKSFDFEKADRRSRKHHWIVRGIGGRGSLPAVEEGQSKSEIFTFLLEKAKICERILLLHQAYASELIVLQLPEFPAGEISRPAHQEFKNNKAF